MEHRKYPRLSAAGMDISISDKIGFSTGTVKDISRFGVCITDIPRKLQPKNDCITVIINNRDKRFKLQLKPQWEKQDGLTMATGTVIDEVPWEWATLIMQLERQNNPPAVKYPHILKKQRLVKTLHSGFVDKPPQKSH